MKWAPFRRGVVVFVCLFGFYSIAINFTPNNWRNLYRLAKSGAQLGRLSRRSNLKTMEPVNLSTSLTVIAIVIGNRAICSSVKYHR